MVLLDKYMNPWFIIDPGYPLINSGLEDCDKGCLKEAVKSYICVVHGGFPPSYIFEIFASFSIEKVLRNYYY